MSKRALRHVDAAHGWWSENRPSAPGLFLDELAHIEHVLRENPTIGTLYAHHANGPVRRVLLAGAEKHLYYRYRAERDELTVLAVWGARRRRGPTL